MTTKGESAATTRRPAARAAFWLAAGWLWVGVPLAWGVTRSVEKSLALFRVEAPTPPAAAEK